ncbi:MAG: hypothetical protein K5894_05335, partial [Lachnospiraceae bacterium]|nr:hypothetical protein [Lachnospiraceae bacterium]
MRVRYREDLVRLFNYMQKLEKLYPGTFTKERKLAPGKTEESLISIVSSLITSFPKDNNPKTETVRKKVEKNGQKEFIFVERPVKQASVRTLKDDFAVVGDFESEINERFLDNIDNIYDRVAAEINNIREIKLLTEDSQGKEVNYHTKAFLDHVSNYMNYVKSNKHGKTFFEKYPYLEYIEEGYMDLTEPKSNGKYSKDLENGEEKFPIYKLGNELNKVWPLLDKIDSDKKIRGLNLNAENKYREKLKKSFEIIEESSKKIDELGEELNSTEDDLDKPLRIDNMYADEGGNKKEASKHLMFPQRLYLGNSFAKRISSHDILEALNNNWPLAYLTDYKDFKENLKACQDLESKLKEIRDNNKDKWNANREELYKIVQKFNKEAVIDKTSLASDKGRQNYFTGFLNNIRELNDKMDAISGVKVFSKAGSAENEYDKDMLDLLNSIAVREKTLAIYENINKTAGKAYGIYKDPKVEAKKEANITKKIEVKTEKKEEAKAENKEKAKEGGDTKEEEAFVDKAGMAFYLTQKLIDDTPWYHFNSSQFKDIKNTTIPKLQSDYKA